jgi:hypothetical protein
LQCMTPWRVARLLSGAVAAALLVACQTTPSSGSDIRAQVHAVPLTRVALDIGATHGPLHGAVRAGASEAQARAKRVVLAGCALPEPGTASGARLYTVTTVLPAGVTPVPGALLQLSVDGDPFSGVRVEGRFPAVHARFVAALPAPAVLDDRTGVAWRLKAGDPPSMEVRCRPVGGDAAQVQAAYFRAVGDSELLFATAEAARHAQFSDAELAAGQVVRVRCRLRMADGGAWHTPEFLARAPAGLSLQAGDVVRLRAGVDEGSRQGGPVGQVLSREDPLTAAQRPRGVDCR